MFQFVKGKRPGFELTLQDIKQIEEQYQMFVCMCIRESGFQMQKCR